MNSSIFQLFRRSALAIWVLAIALLISLFINAQAVSPLTSFNLNTSNQTVIEYLKLSVPKEHKEAWLAAEKESWEPWLQKQRGFIKRELFWDPNKEEALLLISWSSRSDWKSIPQSEVNRVQISFEEIAMKLTKQQFTNPFPIKSEGEFLSQ